MNNRITIVLAAVAVGLAAYAWVAGGPELTLAGLVQGGETLLGVVPLLIAAFLIAGLVQALVTKELIAYWLGSASGWRGIAIACVGGALIPGGPYAYYPIAAALLQAGAGIGVLVAFVTAKNLWSITRLPLEFALLGPHVTVVRFVVTLIFPPLLGVLAETLFGTQVEQIREGAVP